MDWENLKWVLQYIRCTLDEIIILGEDGITTIKTWVDAYMKTRRVIREV